MKVGDYTYGQENIQVYDFGEGAELSIGKFCSIAANVQVFLGGNHRTDFMTTYPFGHIHQDVFPHSGAGHPATKGDVVIKNDVWIGRNVVIMSGVTIGNGAVIGANAVVAKDVPAYSIAVGNPAKVIKTRNEAIVDVLEEVAWWDWSVDKINQFLPLLCQHDPIEFLNAAGWKRLGFKWINTERFKK
jgi:acetyltransferase-like isoleucine patch superfamily enzyme